MGKDAIVHIVTKGVALLLVCAAYKASALTWATYKNPRYGFEVLVPEYLNSPDPVGDEDGRTFQSEDGRAKLQAFGYLDPHEYGSELYLEKVLQPSGVLENGTDIQINGYSIILKGRIGDEVFYENILFTCKDKVVNVLRLTYPADQAELYGALEAKLDRRFSGGLGSRTPLCN